MVLDIMIIEDEPHAVSILEKYLKKIPNTRLRYIFSNPIEGLTALNQHRVDILFLDINLPEISGVDLLKTLANPPKVILTTAYPEYALEGYELEISDFLLKPFSFDRFLKSINKVIQQLELEKKVQQLDQSTQQSHLFIRADRKLYQVPFKEIIMLQAYGDYVKVILEDKQILPKETLQRLATQLPEEQFMRIHRSYVVSLSKIEYLEGNQIRILGQLLPVGKPYREALLNKMKNL